MILHLLLIASITIIIMIIKLPLRRRLNLPPGPPRWPIIGNLHQMKPNWTHCFWEWSRVYGPIISVWFGSELNVVVSSSDLAKQVLKEKDQVLADRHRGRPAAKMSHNGSDLVWSDYGPHYVKVRKICNLELFLPKNLESLRYIRETEAKAMVRSILKDLTISEKKKLVLRKYLGAVTMNNISRLVFGERLGIQEGEEFKSIVQDEIKLSTRINLFDHIWWLRWVSSWFANDEEFSRHLARRRRLTRSIMEVYRDETGYGEAAERKSFVQRLLVLQEKFELSEETVVGLLWDMVTAGMDTVAITVEWAMAQLIKNQTVQRKAQQELDSKIGHHRLMSESDTVNLPYLQCIVKEALRLHPPTPLMLPHKANASVQLGGYEVPKGATIFVNVWAVGRDPGNWRDPDEFQPERFLAEEIDLKGQDFRVLPFGSGRRVCPAAQLSINMVTLVLGHLLHCFSWSSQPDEDIDMTENAGIVCYMKTPLQALASLRLPRELYDGMMD